MNLRSSHGLEIAVAIGLIVCLAVPAVVDGRNVYVIGGTERPWSALTSKLGHTDLMDTSAGLAPMRFKADENIGPTLGERGALLTLTRSYYARLERGPLLFDGDLTTVVGWAFEQWRAGRQAPDRIIVDFPGLYPITRIVFYPREEFPERYPEHYRVYVGDRVNERGYPIYEPVYEETKNRNPRIEVTFEPRPIRFLQVVFWETKPFEIAEVEVYGDGYVPQASYTTDVLDFGASSSWGEIRWWGRRDPGARVFIQTRSGVDDDPTVYWQETGVGGEISFLNEEGKPLTASEYKRLPVKVQAGTTDDFENWSPWSATYDFERGPEGVSIVSPGPARYFQIRMQFFPTATDGVTIDSLHVEFSSPPMAEAVWAEIAPLEVEPANRTRFTYALTSKIGRDHSGFDGLEILTPGRIDAVVSVRVNGAEVDLEEFPPDIEEDRFRVRFPKFGPEKSGALLELEFETAILRYGAEFVGYVFNSELDEVPQRVSPGNATLLMESDELSVRTSLEEPLVASVEASPNPFTPNDDRVNDEAIISYSLLKLLDIASVTLKIYDLSGNVVRTVYSGPRTAGEYAELWDGTDDGGRRVPPGLYVYQIWVDTDVGEEKYAGVVGVVY